MVHTEQVINRHQSGESAEWSQEGETATMCMQLQPDVGEFPAEYFVAELRNGSSTAWLPF